MSTPAPAATDFLGRILQGITNPGATQSQNLLQAQQLWKDKVAGNKVLQLATQQLEQSLRETPDEARAKLKAAGVTGAEITGLFNDANNRSLAQQASIISGVNASNTAELKARGDATTSQNIRLGDAKTNNVIAVQNNQAAIEAATHDRDLAERARLRDWAAGQNSAYLDHARRGQTIGAGLGVLGMIANIAGAFV